MHHCSFVSTISSTYSSVLFSTLFSFFTFLLTQNESGRTLINYHGTLNIFESLLHSTRPTIPSSNFVNPHKSWPYLPVKDVVFYSDYYPIIIEYTETLKHLICFLIKTCYTYYMPYYVVYFKIRCANKKTG